ncbi:MAG: cell division protein FtsQ [Bacteroidetes bacterium]|jgi:cell division protein FtsQ|nr:cell division protein FtsQ [Bacteroidota bacterium]
MIRKVFTYFKIVLLTALVIFLYGFASERNEHKKVTQLLIEFEDGENKYMNLQMVNKLLIQNSKTALKQPKSVIDLHSLEQSVLKHPMVQDVQISLTIEGNLKAKVKQRKPIARVKIEDQSYYIDTQGKSMPLSELHSARVPIITGELINENLREIQYLIEKISNNEFLSKNIVGVHRFKNNEYELYSRIEDYVIELGTVSKVDEKFKNLEAFYKKAAQDSLLNKYSRINIKYHKQVICTKKEDYGV